MYSWRLCAFISITVYLAIRRYDNQAFDDMSEVSEKKTIVKKLLWPVPSQGIDEQAEKKMAA